MPGPLSGARAITKLPAQDIERARRFYRDRLGLEPVEERPGGLRYVCAGTEFHVFASTGAPSGAATQIGFEVDDLPATYAALRERGVVFDEVDEATRAALRCSGVQFEDALPGCKEDAPMFVVEGHYPSKGTGELGVFLHDSEGNVIGIGQPTGDPA